MDDFQKADLLASMATAGDGLHGFEASGGHTGRLRDVLKAIVERFKAANEAVPWGKIISVLPLILQLLAGGGNWAAVLAQILAIFFPPGPPTPTINTP